MTNNNIRPVTIRRAEAPAVYGFSETQLKRWCNEGRLSRVYPSGPTGPCHLLTAELDDLIRRSTVPPGQKAGRKPPRQFPDRSVEPSHEA